MSDLNATQRYPLAQAQHIRYVLAVGVLISALLYFPLNHAFANQHVLTISIDKSLPVVPIFALPYIAFLPVFWLTVLFSFAKDRNFIHLGLAIIITYAISDIVYLCFHTYMPRPEHVSGVFTGVVNYVYAHDHPYNDFPSGHASSAALLALYAWFTAKRWQWRFGALIFAILVVVATVLIRQHSLAGALGGVMLGVTAWITAGYLCRSKLFSFESGIEQNRLHRNRQGNTADKLQDNCGSNGPGTKVAKINKSLH